MSLTTDLQARVRLEVTSLLASLAAGESTLIRSDAQALRVRLASLDALTRSVHSSAPVLFQDPLLWAARALLVALDQSDFTHIVSLTRHLRSELELPASSPLPSFA
jgi:hypothetical protein